MIQHLYSEQEACKYLSIGLNSLRWFRKTNQIPYLMMLGRIKYKREELEKLADKFTSIENGKIKETKLILPNYKQDGFY